MSGRGREYEYSPEEFWTQEFKHGEGKKFVKVYLKNLKLLNNKIYITPDADKAVAANAVMVKPAGLREQLTEQGNTFTHPFPRWQCYRIRVPLIAARGNSVSDARSQR